MMKNYNIGFIGGGKMAEAVIAKLPNRSGIIVSDISDDRLAYLRREYGVKTTSDNQAVFSVSKIVVLAVKPQNFPEMIREVSRKQIVDSRKLKVESRSPLVISIAAGITLSYLEKKLPGCRIIRAMPNNPALVGAGITALAKGPVTSDQQLGVAKKIFQAVGEVVEVPEKLMDAVTGLSGSGPAYVYLMIEALTEAGQKLGLPAKTAEKLAVETVFGAAKTMKVSGKSASELREMVTSPGGTTIEGLKVLTGRGFKQTVAAAVRAAAAKSRKLSN